MSKAKTEQKKRQSDQAIARALNTISNELAQSKRWTAATEQALLEFCRAVPGVTQLSPDDGSRPVYSDTLYMVLFEVHDAEQSKR
jgi:hypothetical protein